MNKLFLFFLGLSFVSNHGFAYYGVNSTEAMLKFETSADVPWSSPPKDKATGKKSNILKTHVKLNADPAAIDVSGAPTVEELNTDGKKRDKAIDLVEEQVQHLMGTFQSASFKDEFRKQLKIGAKAQGVAGVLGEQKNYEDPDYKQMNYKITFKKVEPGTGPGRLLLTYQFEGKSVFDQRAFKSADNTSVPLKLPLSADLIYNQSYDKAKKTNPCTDKDYNDEGDFWYFWDPQQDGCNLANDDKLVLRFDGELTRLPNSTERYPDYNALYADNGNKKTLEIAVLLGYVDDIPNNKVGHTKDTTYQNFKALTAELENPKIAGDPKFTLLKDKDHYKDNFRVSLAGNESKGANFLREYVATIKTKEGTDVEVHIQVLLTDTDINSGDKTFHYYLAPAFEKADVLIYDGHSGLGGNLDLASLPIKPKFDLEKSQVFFFNGCSSYSYYNGMFFAAKKGTKKLDIVNSGLETSSSSTTPNVLAFLKYIVRGDLASYQKILTTLEKSNGKDNGTYLTGVSGETSNRFKPKQN